MGLFEGLIKGDELEFEVEAMIGSSIAIWLLVSQKESNTIGSGLPWNR